MAILILTSILAFIAGQLVFIKFLLICKPETFERFVKTIRESREDKTDDQD